jgi:ABC-type transport system involved in cytochrome c biogenesis permease subunit
MTGWSHWIHWLATAVTGLWLVAAMRPASDAPGEMRLHEFGRLPALANGRVKPLDTVARTNLMILNDRQTFAANQKASEDGKSQSAIKWLLDVTTRDKAALDYQFFRIEDDQVLKLLDLPMRPRWFRYSVSEIGPSFAKIENEAERAANRPALRRDSYDAHLLKLRDHLGLFMILAEGVDPPPSAGRAKRGVAPRVLPPITPDGEWQAFAAIEQVVYRDARDKVQAELQAKGTTFERLSPEEKAAIATLSRKLVEEGLRQAHPAAPAFARLLDAYRHAEVTEFNAALADFQNIAGPLVPRAEASRVRTEVFFNSFAPFYHCTVLYVLVFLLAGLSWLVSAAPLARSAFWLACLTLAVHTAGLIMRMYIQNRPPITNLYSSAVFIGWGCVLLGLILEIIYRNGIGLFAGGVLGFATSLVAHFLGADGDTLEMLQAVLDTNFWLATHVTIVNLGYTATLVPGLLGAVYIVRGIGTRSLSSQASKSMGQMMYGIICFATLLSFTGTVLGGIWADQSWGRFWGWDPKENGALLIVIWNALILHARWGGMIKTRGMAILAVLGNIVTIWSWFGTNQLGVGLHAYGFRSGMAKWIVISSLTHLAIASLGMLPLKYWRSYSQSALVHTTRSGKSDSAEKPA